MIPKELGKFGLIEIIENLKLTRTFLNETGEGLFYATRTTLCRFLKNHNAVEDCAKCEECAKCQEEEQVISVEEKGYPMFFYSKKYKK